MLAAYPPGDCEVQTLKIDPEFQSLIPALSEDERAELEASLKAEGCRDALVVWAGQGVIVDGHNRYAICQAHGIPFEVKEHEFEDRDAAKEWILRNQLARRNLNDYSRGALALRLKGVIAARAKARMLAGKPADPPVNLPEGKGDTRDALGAVAGVSGRTIDKVEAVERDAPEPVKVAARAGDISTNRAYEITRALKALPEADRARAAEICIDHDEKARTLVRLHKSQHTDPDSNGTYEEILRTGGFHYGDDLEKWCDFKAASLDTINDALKSLAKHHAHEQRLARQEKRAILAQSLAQEVFNVVLADPPWEYSVQNVNGAANNHYDTMPLEDICALPEQLGIKFADNAVLFLWVTNPFLVKALEVVRAWGFEYKTNIVWVKTDLKRPGAGHYIRGRHELLYICTRGTMTPLVDVSPPIGSVIHAPLQEHSRKPDEVYSIIERLYPGCNYVEFFARRPRDGWKQYGDIEENEEMAA